CWRSWSSPRPGSRPARAPTASLCCSRTRTARGGTARRSAAAGPPWRPPDGPVGGLGPYGVQAAIAECHAVARSVDETDWARVVLLYDVLARLAPSPVVALNRAVAVAMAEGPAAGLA